jgi:hypothetical protein
MTRLAVLLKDRLHVFVEADRRRVCCDHGAGHESDNDDRRSQDSKAHCSLHAVGVRKPANDTSTTSVARILNLGGVR